MPRIRYLKPEFFTDEDLGNLPFQTRLTFAGLWVHADKAGRLEYRPKYLKAMIFPYDAVKIEKEIELLSNGKPNGTPFIQLYNIENKQFIQINHWDKHQRPHHTEKESEIPPAPPLNTTEKGMGMENQLNPSKELRNGEITVKEPLTPHINNDAEEIISYLNKKTSRSFKPTPQNIKLIKTRMNEGFKKENFLTVIDNQCDKWLCDDKMVEYLRPITLFSPKFESYLNNTPQKKEDSWIDKVNRILEK